MDVIEMLQKLSPEHREVIVLRELQGMGYEEMAEALKIPRGTVESRLHRATAGIEAKDLAIDVMMDCANTICSAFYDGEMSSAERECI
jgi:predicted RNA polymerase sigma factor